eukprot:CCRYP_007519-RA/>CCRYP_007519-RA protein AED:0.37 eAED:1.00 QI:0/-1/0/1/-1/0/1/0/66
MVPLALMSFVSTAHALVRLCISVVLALITRMGLLSGPSKPSPTWLVLTCSMPPSTGLIVPSLTYGL